MKTYQKIIFFFCLLPGMTGCANTPLYNQAKLFTNTFYNTTIMKVLEQGGKNHY